LRTLRSHKLWSTGLDVTDDPYGRFKTFGTPPAKQGDYAYLLHIVRSLKSTGKGACILPHSVLFRGNAEGEIRRKLVKHGYIKGIIGLPYRIRVARAVAMHQLKLVTEAGRAFVSQRGQGRIKPSNDGIHGAV
jgi:hypothetical protein